MRARLAAAAVLGLCAAADGQPAPKEIVSLARGLKTAAGRGSDIMKAVGPVAFQSDTVAARLPTEEGAKPSKAWGEDRLKGVSVASVMNGDFSLSRFAVSGTDGKSSAHSFAGAGYTGVDKKHGRDAANYVLAASKITPTDSSLVVAIPSKGGKSGHDLDGGLKWGSLSAKSSQGHATPEELKRWWLSRAQEGAKEAAELKKEQRAQRAPVQQQAAPVQQQAAPVEQKAAAVQQEALVEQKSPVQQKAPVEQTQKAKEGDKEEQKGQATAMTAEEKEEERKAQEYIFHMAQLMMLNFPQPSAQLFALFRSWCLEKTHALSPSDEASRLKLLEGRWKVVKDNDFPDNVGNMMVIKDSKIPAPFGEGPGGDVTFRAYKESRFAGILPVKSPLGNGTVDIYRMFKITDNKLMEWDDGNVWEWAPEQAAERNAMVQIRAAVEQTKATVEPAKADEKPTMPLLKDFLSKLGDAAKDAKSGDAEKRKASGAAVKDAIKKLGDAAKSRAAEHSEKKKQLPKPAFSDVLSKLGDVAKSAAAAQKQKEQGQQSQQQPGSSFADIFSKLGDAAKSAAAQKEEKKEPGSTFADIFSKIGKSLADRTAAEAQKTP